MKDPKRADFENHNVLWTDESLRDSPAFRSLSRTAIVILMDFYSKRRTRKQGRQKYILTNNGELVYTYNEAEKKGISKATFMRALDALIDRGFIDVKVTGAGRYRSESRYALSNQWRYWGTDKFITRKRNPHGRNKKYGVQLGHTLRQTNGNT
jgi:hypothetical protein